MATVALVSDHTRIGVVPVPALVQAHSRGVVVPVPVKVVGDGVAGYESNCHSRPGGSGATTSASAVLFTLYTLMKSSTPHMSMLSMSMTLPSQSVLQLLSSTAFSLAGSLAPQKHLGPFNPAELKWPLDAHFLMQSSGPNVWLYGSTVWLYW